MSEVNFSDPQPELSRDKKLLFAAIAGMLVLGITASAYYVIRAKQTSLLDESTEIPKTDVTKNTQNIAEKFEQLQPEYETQFSSPYDTEWTEGGAVLTLTGVSLGKIKAPPSPPTQSGSSVSPGEQSYFLKPSGGYYAVGEELYALTLSFKIKTGQSSVGCIPLNMRLITKENDFIAPLQRQWYFPSSSGCQGEPNVTYQKQRVVFEVSPEQKDFNIYRFTTNGVTYLSFKLHLNDNGEFSVEKVLLEPPVSARGATTPGTVNIRLISPIAPVTIQRGAPLQLAWDISGTLPSTSSSRVFVVLRLNSDPTIKQTIQSLLLTEKKASFTIEAPPGLYTLEFSSNTYNQKQTISVEVTGQPPAVSPKESYFYLDTPTQITGRITADGACGMIAYVSAVDEFKYPLANPKIEVKSDRGLVDTILPLSGSATDDLAFLITSKTVGTVQLRAYVNSVVLTEVPVVQVLDPANNACPEDSSNYNGGGGI